MYLDYGYINSHARDKGLSLVMWQTSLLLLILLCVYIIVRQVVTKPLHLLLEQIRTTPVDGVRTGDEIRIQSNDEIGFLAENTNNLLKRIADFYRSEAKNNQHILKLERQFRIIFEHSHAGILLLDENNQVHLANPSVKSMLQCKPGSDWHSSFASLFDDKSQFEATLQQVREEGISLFKDFRLRDNDDVWLRVLFSNVENVHNLDLEKFVELVIYDISDRAQKEKNFAYNATHDALTGIFNRRGAEVRFNETVQQCKSVRLSFSDDLVRPE
ncbi:PAS domain-containing protein [Vibrio sp. CDRSL-10 TSBA]